MRNNNIVQKNSGNLKIPCKVVRVIKITGFKDRRVIVRINRGADYPVLGGPGYSMI